MPVLIDELPAGLLVYVSGSGNGAGPYSALVTADGAFRRLPEVVDEARRTEPSASAQ